MIKHSKQKNLTQKVLLPVLIGFFFLGTLFSQSLADLARQGRARKAQEGKPAKVFTNDDVATSPPAPPAAPKAATAAAAGEEAGKKAAPAEGDKAAAAGKKEEAKPAGESGKSQANLEKEYREKFTKLRDQVDYETKKLDVNQRELNLNQTQYYSDPNVALREQTFRGEIDKQAQEIDQQKVAVEKAKQAVSDLEEELRKKDLPAGWAR